MMKTDHYLTLSVSRGESLRGIHEAFRELAKRYHPDRAGPDGARQFQQIREAYEILSNPETRKMYNNDLEQTEEKQARPEPIVSHRRFRPEPLIPKPMSILHEFETIHPSFESLYERFVRNFTRKAIPKAERPEPLNIEVTFSDREARGGALCVSVPVFVKCRQCDGSGHDWLFPCANCHAEGLIEVEAPIEISIPPIRPDKSIIEIPLQRLGIQNFYLSLHMRISR